MEVELQWHLVVKYRFCARFCWGFKPLWPSWCLGFLACFWLAVQDIGEMTKEFYTFTIIPKWKTINNKVPLRPPRSYQSYHMSTGSSENHIGIIRQEENFPRFVSITARKAINYCSDPQGFYPIPLPMPAEGDGRLAIGSISTISCSKISESGGGGVGLVECRTWTSLGVHGATW